MVAKLTDVAKLAGVSPTTVSRVINKKGYLSEKTIQKVQEAMRELGYKPNNVARSLQGKSAKLIGLIFPKISHVFYAELIDKLEEELFTAANELNIGPQGMGGKTTVFRINVEYYPTHIAGLPCAVNISCHVTRHAKEVL